MQVEVPTIAPAHTGLQYLAQRVSEGSATQV